MHCELVHVIGMSVEEAEQKVQYLQVHNGLSHDLEPRKRAPLKKASREDIVVLNLGHHVGWKLGENWTLPYKRILEEALAFDFGPIPNKNIFFRTTSVRHFLKGFGDYDTNSSKVGNDMPNMDAKWADYGGNRPELPKQNLIAFEVFLGNHTSNSSDHKIQILDTSPMMLARGDASFDGSHYCLPGPMEFWSRMLYHRLEIMRTSGQ